MDTETQAMALSNMKPVSAASRPGKNLMIEAGIADVALLMNAVDCYEQAQKNIAYVTGRRPFTPYAHLQKSPPSD